MTDLRVRWKDEPEAHDYPAARDFLGLLMGEAAAAEVVARLATAPMVRRRARDILRACGLPVLPRDQHDVARDLRRMEEGKLLSPVLLVRGNLALGAAATLADGYHRVCASYHVNDQEEIPCRIVDLG